MKVLQSCYWNSLRVEEAPPISNILGSTLSGPWLQGSMQQPSCSESTRVHWKLESCLECFFECLWKTFGRLWVWDCFLEFCWNPFWFAFWNTFRVLSEILFGNSLGKLLGILWSGYSCCLLGHQNKVSGSCLVALSNSEMHLRNGQIVTWYPWGQQPEALLLMSGGTCPFANLRCSCWK